MFPVSEAESIPSWDTVRLWENYSYRNFANIETVFLSSETILQHTLFLFTLKYRLMGAPFNRGQMCLWSWQRP